MKDWGTGRHGGIQQGRKKHTISKENESEATGKTKQARLQREKEAGQVGQKSEALPVHVGAQRQGGRGADGRLWSSKMDKEAGTG
jgi:hypothetical protein